jgi:hypothetical protein
MVMASVNLPNSLGIRGAEDFYEYLSGFTQTLAVDVSSQETRLMAIYDFIIRNFSTQREGSAIDGLSLPLVAEIPQVDIMTTFRSENNKLFYAWMLFASGQGVCDNFAALFAYMAKSIGYDVDWDNDTKTVLVTSAA